MMADQHGDVVISSAILNPPEGIHLIGSRPLKNSKDQTDDVDLSG
jgi:hypothetical protein